MIQRRTPLKRSTKPIRRRAWLKRSGRPRQKSPARAKTDRQYSGDRLAYLAVHPFCQIAIAQMRLVEADVIKNDGIGKNGQRIPQATQIHHRNKARGPRKLDQRWWLSACDGGHDDVENHKSWARSEGFLLPFEADADGRCPGGRALETPAFMAARAAGKPAVCEQ